jgi:hypothetical protein
MAPDAPHDDQDKGPEALAQEMEREAERLQERSRDLGQDIQETRQEWERKQSDPGVPGAVGDPDEADAESAPADAHAPGDPESHGEGESEGGGESGAEAGQ